MKKILFFAGIFVTTLFAKAQQNVGIGTNTPQATLDVKGNQRLGGAAHFTSFDSVGGKIEWRNANLYVPVSQYLMQHSAAADGLYYNNNAPISGQLEYRNATGNPVFYTNFINGNGYFKNNLGINNLTPQFPLSFNGSLGDKISLWTDGTPTHYGFGIQSSLLQIFAKTNLDDIAFGYGSSNSFSERMRIINNGSYDGMILNGRLILKNGSADLVGGGGGAWLYKADNSALLGFMGAQNNQNVGFYGGPAGWGFVYDAINSRVGIGNNNPAYQLDISGRMRIMSGGNNSASAGLWLNNNANTEAAFIGMEDDTHVGLFGNNGAGWKLSMNTQTGALKINGTEGAAGQILTSGGAGTSASWADPSTKPYAFEFKPSQFTTLSGVQLSVPITGLDNIFLNLNQNSTVLYTVTAPISGGGPGTIDSKGYLVVDIIGGTGRVSYASSDYYIKRSTSTSQTASGVAVNLPAGFYTIKASLARLSPGDGDVSTHASFNSNQQGIQLIVQVLPN
jgi:hypothetical protein